jgi:hypothetical protein
MIVFGIICNLWYASKDTSFFNQNPRQQGCQSDNNNNKYTAGWTRKKGKCSLFVS